MRFQLTSADVIHSFWVPALSGKTDTIPGQTNVTWLQADTPGTYRGQCTEFCGWQHAHMGFLVVAQRPPSSGLGGSADQAGASPPSSAKSASGEQTFEYRCGACHTVRGSKAGGSVAPDLTHIMSRSTLAAATLPHTIGTFGLDRQSTGDQAGVRMPGSDVSGGARAHCTYLETLN